VAHVLIGEPVPTSPEHALTRVRFQKGQSLVVSAREPADYRPLVTDFLIRT
jgi:hypothetical protein